MNEPTIALDSICLENEIPILNSSGIKVGSLRLIVVADDISSEIVECMTKWRNQGGVFFLTQFHATKERTEKWLTETLLPDRTRGMYLIQDCAGALIGHLGVRRLDTSCPELDNMLRGRSSGDPQIMRFAEIALISSIFKCPRATAINLKVLSRNWIAITLHHSLGFQITGRDELFTQIVRDEVHYVTTPNAGEKANFEYLTMTVTPTEFKRSIDALQKEA